MKIVEKNCVKKQGIGAKRKGMAIMGKKSYITTVPNVLIEVVRNKSMHMYSIK